MTVEDVATIWVSCKALEQLAIVNRCGLAVDTIPAAACKDTLKRLAIDFPEGILCPTEAICHTFQNLEEFTSSQRVLLLPRDIRALAGLAKLSKINITVASTDGGGGDGGGDAMLEAFSALCSSVPSAAPFREIVISGASDAIRPLVSSRRCHELVSLSLCNCHVSKEVMAALADNAQATLTSFKVDHSSDSFVEVLTRCKNLERFAWIPVSSNELADRVASINMPSLRTVHVTLTSPCIRLSVLAPTFQNVVDMTILGNGELINVGEVVLLTKSCPSLRYLSIPSHNAWFRRHNALPSTVQLCS
jgi:hypothetical protein